MHTDAAALSHHEYALPTILDEQSNETFWISLYHVLLPLAKRWVYAAHTHAWAGQENDIAWDIVLVAIQRTYEYKLKAQDENIPIASLQHLSIRIAKNYFQDLVRKDRRLQPLDRDSDSEVAYTSHDEIDIFEAVSDKVYEEWLFHEIAKEIANYPPKMRKALLIDIALRMDFDTQPTPLQAAFLEAGIQLQDFKDLFPEDPITRSRHAALVSLGYKRLAMLLRTQDFGDSNLNSTPSSNAEKNHESAEQENMKGEPSDQSTDASVEYIGSQADIAAHIGELKEPYRTALYLKRIEACSYPDIATQLKLKIGTVKSHVSRGMKMLHRLVEQNNANDTLSTKPETQLDLTKNKAALAVHINELPEPYQTTVRLHYLEGLTYLEIAERLELPKGTVKSHVSRGMKMLSKLEVFP